MRAFASSLTAIALAAGLSLGANGSPDTRSGVVLAQSDVPQSGSVQGVTNPASGAPQTGTIGTTTVR